MTHRNTMTSLFFMATAVVYVILTGVAAHLILIGMGVL